MRIELITHIIPPTNPVCIVKKLDKHSSKWGYAVLSSLEEVENLAHCAKEDICHLCHYNKVFKSY